MENTYYLSANSCTGFTSFLCDCINSHYKVIVLRNATFRVKEMLFDEFKETAASKGYSVDTIISAGFGREPDALIVPEAKTVIADEIYFDNEMPLNALIYDFFDCCEKSTTLYEKCEKLKCEENKMRKEMFLHLKAAKTIHDDWEQIYIRNMDFEKINTETDKLINEIFGQLPIDECKNAASDVQRFFGSMLSSGGKNYIRELTENVSTRIFIKGRPGTGKSTILKKVREAAHLKGMNTETYRCSFDCDSLDMVIVRDINMCIFDSTPPHEIMPEREGDSIFDVYEKAVCRGTDEYNSSELEEIKKRYNSEMNLARDYLRRAILLKMESEETINLYLSRNGLNSIIKEILAVAG